jgi:hypothetical protein
MGKVVKALGSIFKMPKVQTPEAAGARMPDPENVQAKIAARKKAQDRLKEGRAGTIYTSSGNYGGTNLGGTA